MDDTDLKKSHFNDIKKGERFEFGKNWKRFLSCLNEERISEAEKSLKSMIGMADFRGLSFLDIGSGSGLFSLAARRLGAKVHSFDYDPQAVACTTELKNRYFEGDSDWIVEHASILDKNYTGKLSKFDIVYSWGVLHHTSNMMEALSNAGGLVSENGHLYIAIYNKQPFLSTYWLYVKKTYNAAPRLIKILMEIFFSLFFVLRMLAADILRRENPLKRYRGMNKRGMNIFVDITDWIGGLPFETAAPEEIFKFYRDRGFSLKELVTCAGKHGCNEYVFKKNQN